MTEAQFCDMFMKVVGTSNPNLLRLIRIGTRITLNTEFSHHQLWSARSNATTAVFPDVNVFEISTVAKTDKNQFFMFKRKNTNTFMKIGFWNRGQIDVAGMDVIQMADVMPGQGHAFSRIQSLTTRDPNGGGFHTSYVRVAQRKIRAGSTAEKNLTPEGLKVTYDTTAAKVANLEAKIAKLEKLLKIRL